MVNHLRRDRAIAMVFQSYALDPHLSCREHRLRIEDQEGAEDEIERRVNDAAALGLESFLKRKPRALSAASGSGGDGTCDRPQPQAFLMDEPCRTSTPSCASDARGDSGIQPSARRHHDLRHARQMRDDDGRPVAVMRRGELQQVADPQTL